jgi:hypothetical protein
MVHSKGRFHVVQRVKDGQYYYKTDPDGQVWFVSDLKTAKKFYDMNEARGQIKKMQNWLKRPKFILIVGGHISW